MAKSNKKGQSSGKNMRSANKSSVKDNDNITKSRWESRYFELLGVNKPENVLNESEGINGKINWEDRYIELLSKYNAAMTPIHLIVDQGTAPNEAIADLLSDISILYRMYGGSGINFELDGIISLKS